MATELTKSAQVGHTVQYQYGIATGAAAIDHIFTVAGYPLIIDRLTLAFSAAPTTSENLIIKIDSISGAAYDVELYNRDAASISLTDLVLTSDDFGAMPLAIGDILTVTFTNTDTRTWALTVALREA
jgi:hypothetical protein